MKVQEIQVELKLNGTHQLLAYADDVNLLGDNIDTIRRDTEILIDASKKVGLGYAVAKWLRHYVTNRKVAGSIPDEENF
jgi:hypothetical protein